MKGEGEGKRKGKAEKKLIRQNIEGINLTANKIYFEVFPCKQTSQKKKTTKNSEIKKADNFYVNSCKLIDNILFRFILTGVR